jgi:hypothetical protein
MIDTDQGARGRGYPKPFPKFEAFYGSQRMTDSLLKPISRFLRDLQAVNGYQPRKTKVKFFLRKKRKTGCKQEPIVTIMLGP